MFLVFLGFIAQQFAVSAFYFFIVWAVMRKRNGMTIGDVWLVPGIFATAFVCGLARFAFWIVSGENASAPLSEKATSFFFIGLPILIAIALCAFLRRQKS
jgi:hypothetical protein